MVRHIQHSLRFRNGDHWRSEQVIHKTQKPCRDTPLGQALPPGELQVLQRFGPLDRVEGLLGHALQKIEEPLVPRAALADGDQRVMVRCLS